MTIENLRVDTTTHSRVFNPLSAAGQWLCSAFHHRHIGDINMSYPVLVEITQDLPKLKSITMDNEYGDALEWDNLSSFVRVMTIQGVYTIVNTYGMADKSVVKKIIDASCLYKGIDSSIKIIFNIDGIHEQCGKVFLGAEWKHIKENIISVGQKAHIKFYKFKHNAHQQAAIENFCKAVGAEFEVLEDPLFGSKCFSVISKQGKWLYDIHPVGSFQPTLHQTSLGWNYLKTKVRKIKGTSIDKLTNLSVPFTATNLETDDIINVTIKGHVIKGSGIAQIFSYALCDDWNSEEIDISNVYNLTVIQELAKFTRMDLSDINVYDNSITDILEVI
tara:strand:+ start:75 stop:1070 length:996 start_codon:yes stop_codon:yes gene_type:complete